MAADKVALICGTPSPACKAAATPFHDSKSVHIETIYLDKINEFPAEEIFQNFLKTSVIRVEEKSSFSSTISEFEFQFWIDFLASRGSLIVFSDNFSAHNSNAAKDFHNYVGFHVENIDPVFTLEGIKNDLVTDQLNIDLSSPVSSEFILDTEMAEGILLNKEKITAFKEQSCTFKTVQFPFTPDTIKDAKTTTTLMKQCLDWILGYALSTGMKAPDFPVTLLDGSNEGLYNLFQKHPEKVYVVEFMATWCSSCAKQTPRMVNLHNKFQDDVEFLFISYKETIDTVKEYLNTHPEIKWTLGITENGLGAKRYGVKALPGIFLIDQERTVRFLHKEVTPEETLERQIRILLLQQKFRRLYSSRTGKSQM
jgi:thiol-disulfide isomerase/thioredoxin